MQLYGALASPYVSRVVLTARWKGIELPISPTPGGGIRSPEYQLINPIGKIPALEVDGQYLAESVVICEYLEDLHRGIPLLPQDAFARARVRLLIRVADLYILPHVSVLFRNLNPATRNATDVAAAKALIDKGVGDLEKFLGDGPWVAGSERTLADAVLVPSFWFLFALMPMVGLGDLFGAHPKLTRWWQLVEADETAKALHHEFYTSFMAFAKARAS